MMDWGGGGATRICGDKNKRGLKWDVRSWAEFNWAKAWPLVKNGMCGRGLNSTGLRRGLL